MADRRGRGDGSDDYDWLYGQDGPRRPAEDDDSTRVVPTSPRPGRSGRSGDDGPPTHIAPTPGGRPGSPPPPSARRPGTTGRRRPRFRLRWLLWLLLAYVVFLVAVPVYAWTTVSKVNADPEGDRPEEQPGTTYLVVGSDARAGLSGRRTDTIMLLHTGSGPNLLMSIPRDSIVEVPGHGTTKINAAFAFGGPRLLTRTIENETGIRIDHYVEIGFRGFVELVDAVGGIEICPETAMNDPQAELKIPQGCQEVDGVTALGYARSRKTQSLGDIDRARHQREVVSAIASEVVSWKTVVNPLRYWNVVTSGADSVRVSKGTGPVAAAKFALGMTRVDGKSGLTCGVPIADLAVNWDRERADQLFGLIAEDRTEDVGKDLCRPTGIAD
ncbi:MAG TPA: LCP family protein [Marmoricola sp.]|nr:LCP family protein [Marmoricola sp.]